MITVTITKAAAIIVGLHDDALMPGLRRVEVGERRWTLRGEREAVVYLAGCLEDRADPAEGFEHTPGERRIAARAAALVRSSLASVRIPRAFYDDHVWRDLPAPPIVRATARHYWIERDHPALPELLSDARHHVSEAMYFDPPRPDLASSARATARALEEG